MTSAYTFAYTLAAGCAHAFMCVQFVHSSLGNKGGGVQLVYEGTCSLAWGVVFDRRRDRGVVCVFSIFNAGGSVCECMCVYTHTHTHTHTAQMGYLDVSPGVGKRHLEGLKNPDGLNLGIYVFVYVFKAGMHQPRLVWYAPRGTAIVHMYIYMLRGGRRSWTNCFFVLYIFSKKSKRCKCKTIPQI